MEKNENTIAITWITEKCHGFLHISGLKCELLFIYKCINASCEMVISQTECQLFRDYDVD